jgi:hypothetical protein
VRRAVNARTGRALDDQAPGDELAQLLEEYLA